jgi:hypothetical protein
MMPDWQRKRWRLQIARADDLEARLADVEGRLDDTESALSSEISDREMADEQLERSVQSHYHY